MMGLQQPGNSFSVKGTIKQINGEEEASSYIVSENLEVGPLYYPNQGR